MSGNVGTTLLKAQVEAGKRYYAWLDVGEFILRVRLTPITREQSSDLEKWLAAVEWMEVNPDSVTSRVREREDLVTEFVQSAGKRAATGDADFSLLAGGHAF